MFFLLKSGRPVPDTGAKKHDRRVSRDYTYARMDDIRACPWDRAGLFSAGQKLPRSSGENPTEARRREEDQIDARLRTVGLIWIIAMAVTLVVFAVLVE